MEYKVAFYYFRIYESCLDLKISVPHFFLALLARKMPIDYIVRKFSFNQGGHINNLIGKGVLCRLDYGKYKITEDFNSVVDIILRDLKEEGLDDIFPSQTFVEDIMFPYFVKKRKK